MQPSDAPLIHRQTFTIRSYDVDFKRLLRPDVLCSYFQEVASEHALRLGVGYQQLEEQRMFWVLSRLLLQVERMPAWHEQITVETWAKGTERLFALRDFVVRNADDEVLCKATSYWLILNQGNHRPVRPDTFFARLKHEKDALSARAEKLPEVLRQSEVYALQVRYMDLDHNLHVNNLRYINWLFNCFKLSFLERQRLKTVQVNFLSEVQEGEEVIICREALTNSEFLMGGFRQSEEGAACFSAVTTWERIKS